MWFRRGLGPPVWVFPLFTPEIFTAEKEIFRGNHDVKSQPSPSEVIWCL